MKEGMTMNLLMWIKRIICFPFLVVLGFFAWLAMGFSALTINIGSQLRHFKNGLNKKKD